MNKNNFKVSPNITQEQLIKYGFHRIYPSYYIYKVPCYNYNKQPLIFLEFIITFEVNDKKRFINPTLAINCKDKNDNPYAPFYRKDCINKNEVLDKVNRKLILIVSDMIKKEIIIKKYNKKKKEKTK